jgi:two-component system, cell cycle sensor histidine kinase and response regulator CckA
MIDGWHLEAPVRALLDALPSRVMVFDRHGELVYLNRRGSSNVIDDLFHGPRVEDFPAELREVTRQVASLARKSGTAADGEIQVTGYWCRLRAIPLERGRGAFALVVDDYTEHRRAEAELRASSAKAAAVLEALPDLVFRIDSRGMFLDVRDERGDLFPAQRIEVLGKQLGDVFPVKLAADLAAATDCALRTGELQRVEGSMATAAGSREIEARLVASGPDEAVVVVRDMTETRFLQERLALAERLSALGSLSAGVAHEINNPLTYIIIGIESVLKELGHRGPDDPVGPRLPALVARLRGALEGAGRVRDIVSDLRSFARAEEEEERAVDPCAVLEAAVAMVAGQIQNRGTLVREFGPVPRVLGNHDRLVQVFVNLLLNAAQCLSDAEETAHFIRLRTGEDEDRCAVIEVEDSGPGIASEDLGRIFDPFFTTRPIGEGTGLGLWVCHSIVTSHRGTITVRSRPGQGTTFRVVLPAAPRHLAAP